MDYEGLIEVKIIGGYYSKIGDLNQVEFSICEDCLLEIFKTFKYTPCSSEYNVNSKPFNECFEDKTLDNNE
jgi:hypothetical protein